MFTHFRRARNIRRFNKIITVLARHGFGSFLEYLQVDRYLPLPPRILKQKAEPKHLSPAEHFRLALEELGPTFIKLGQILSTRPDIFPPQFVVELSKLQDQVPPTPWERVHALLEEEYGAEPEKVFAEIDPIPLGSASLAQVHAARLPDGNQVVLKIQRPSIRHTIDADLDILNDLAGLAQRTTWGELYDPVEIVSQFAFTLYNELDYRFEGFNADRFRTNFSREPHLYIPKVYWEFSTPRVIVLERLEGIKIDDIAALDAAGVDRHQVARHASRMLIQEIMQDGFFHADPHPGNFFVMTLDESAEVNHSTDSSPDTSRVMIGAMDFGMVGHISNIDRLNMIQAYNLASKSDSRGVVEHMLRIGAISSKTDVQSLERDIDRMINRYRGLSLKHIETRRVIEELMQIAFEYHIELPSDMWLLFKTLTMMDGLARRLDPDFDLFAEFEPNVRRIILEQYLPWVWGPSFLEDIGSLAYLAKDIPGIVERLLRGLQRGELPFSMSMGADKQTLDRLDQVSTRFSLSVLVSAFILGLALLLPVASENHFAIGLVVIGFLFALGLGFWLAFSILRSGK
jgi:ubiquinone biosynthesis protein